jgi:hypothetical protein
MRLEIGGATSGTYKLLAVICTVFFMNCGNNNPISNTEQINAVTIRKTFGAGPGSTWSSRLDIKNDSISFMYSSMTMSSWSNRMEPTDFDTLQRIINTYNLNGIQDTFPQDSIPQFYGLQYPLLFQDNQNRAL